MYKVVAKIVDDLKDTKMHEGGFMDAEEVEQALKVMGVVGDNSKISKIEFKGGRCGGRRGRKVLPHPEILQGGLHLPIQENHRSRFLREGCHPGGGQTGTAEARKILWLVLPRPCLRIL